MLSMNKLIYFFTFLFFGNAVNAQFGISARYQSNTNSQWDALYQNVGNTNDKLFSTSLEFGVNYWFRLKENRIEFLPEITYALANTNLNNESLEVIDHKRRSYNFNMNIQIYPLDFKGDCNCPTFSKDGNIISKGFYWLLSPGISFHKLSSTFPDDSTVSASDQSITSFRVGIGAGLDIGLTDIITVSPFAMYSQNFSNNWPSQYYAYDINTTEPFDNISKIKQWHIGIRLIFRPDYKGF